MDLLDSSVGASRRDCPTVDGDCAVVGLEACVVLEDAAGRTCPDVDDDKCRMAVAVQVAGRHVGDGDDAARLVEREVLKERIGTQDRSRDLNLFQQPIRLAVPSHELRRALFGTHVENPDGAIGGHLNPKHRRETVA